MGNEKEILGKKTETRAIDPHYKRRENDGSLYIHSIDIRTGATPQPGSIERNEVFDFVFKLDNNRHSFKIESVIAVNSAVIQTYVFYPALLRAEEEAQAFLEQVGFEEYEVQTAGELLRGD